jgi:adenylosuccinate synthase
MIPHIVLGLGAGDEGKGKVTAALTRENKHILVVRFNGGAQAAHNVVNDDGTHHTFHQFGSGTFEGAATLLSRFMLVNPWTLQKEFSELVGKTGKLQTMLVDKRAVVAA